MESSSFGKCAIPCRETASPTGEEDLTARVFITGSADGLGLMAGRLLVEKGHRVVLHARNAKRAEETRQRLPASEAVVVGDLASLAQTLGVA